MVAQVSEAAQDEWGAPVPSSRSITVAGRSIPVRGPSIRDPRMRVAAVIFSLHAIGLLWLGFEVSIAQIAICLAVGFVVEGCILLVRERALVWPASGLLAANGIAFIFRVNGTEHGDWWSTRGWGLFAACAFVAVLSKHVIVVGDRHLFNPSNFSLVLCFLLFGTDRVNPLDFWWAPWQPALVLAYAVIVFGGLTLVRRIDMVPMVAAAWAALAAGLAVVAASGHAMEARWHVGPVTDWSFWWVVVSSPEVLVFLFFMVTDPRTAPRGRAARVAFGLVVGLSSALLIAPQGTEFAAKVGLLAGLVVGCALRPVLERAFPPAGSPADDLVAVVRGWARGRRIVVPMLPMAAVIVVVALLVAGGPARVASDPAAGIDRGVVAARPVVTGSLGQMPAVHIDEGARHLNGSITAEDAERLVTDVLVGLDIERRALADRDLSLVATAVAGPRLRAVERELAGSIAGSPPTRPVVRAEQATVVAVRDPTNPQAVPVLGVRLTGVTGTAGGGAGDGDGGGSEPVTVTYAVVEVDGVHLITDEVAVGATDGAG